MIDDSDLVRLSWEASALKHQQSLTTFASPGDFLAVMTTFSSKETTVYIDSDLGLAEPGEQTARRLAEFGFENVYVTTGHRKDRFKDMWWLKGICRESSSMVNQLVLPWHVAERGPCHNPLTNAAGV